MYRIVLCSSLQEWCGVKLSRCEMWAQAVGEIHFLCLHRDDRETGRPPARQAVTNSRWQPQSEELASNDNVSEEVIAGDNGAKHLFVVRSEIPCIIFCLIELFLPPSACNITFISDTDPQKWTICLWNMVICFYFISLTMMSACINQVRLPLQVTEQIRSLML